MHIIESYAANCGAKISKPYLYQTFFPVPFERYVTFHMEDEASRAYDYWQDVINIISPVLKQVGITIIQIGEAKGIQLSECISYRGQTSPNQNAYIIERSMLHFGSDGFLLQLAGAYNVPLVGLFSVIFPECTKPYFGNPANQRIFTSYDRAKLKPSFSSEENPKTINLIKPEEIAQAILDLLKINFQIPFETLFTGKKYSHLVIEESIPNHPAILFNPEHQVEIRCDLEYDEQAFIHQLLNYKKAVVVLDKPINLNILGKLKNNIGTIVFKIVDDTQKDYLGQLVGIGRNVILISTLSPERIAELKPLYYAFGNINRIETVEEDKINELKKQVKDLYYRSIKVTGSGGRFYYSYAASKNDALMVNHHEYQKVIDVPTFWENLNCFTIVKKKDLTSDAIPAKV